MVINRVLAHISHGLMGINGIFTHIIHGLMGTNVGKAMS